MLGEMAGRWLEASPAQTDLSKQAFGEHDDACNTDSFCFAERSNNATNPTGANWHGRSARRAQQLNCSPASVRRLISDGELRAHRLKKEFQIPDAEMQRFTAVGPAPTQASAAGAGMVQQGQHRQGAVQHSTGRVQHGSGVTRSAQHTGCNEYLRKRTLRLATPGAASGIAHQCSCWQRRQCAARIIGQRRRATRRWNH